MKRFLILSILAMGAAACQDAPLVGPTSDAALTTPSLAVHPGKVTYNYAGRPFDSFIGSSYSITDFVSAELVVDDPFPPNQFITLGSSPPPGFSLTISDGQQVLHPTDPGLALDPGSFVITDADGNFVEWLISLGRDDDPTYRYIVTIWVTSTGLGDDSGCLTLLPVSDCGGVSDRMGTWTLDLGGPVAVTKALIDDVGELVSDGMLTGREGAALRAKLESALAAIDTGRNRPAANKLNAFVNQVDALVRSGRLSSSQGQTLVDLAQGVIDLLRA